MTNMPPSLPGKEPGTAIAGKTKVLDLDYNIAAMLAYLPLAFVNLVSSLVWFKTEPAENQFLRFHAAQSLVLIIAHVAIFAACWLVCGILSFIPLINMIVPLIWMAYGLVAAAFLIVNIVMMIKAYRGEEYRLPYVADLAQYKLLR